MDYSNPYAYLKMMEHGISGLPPLIISVAITGGIHGKELNSNLPELPEEQAEQTYEAYKAGASLVHIHRRKRENPSVTSSDVEDYKEINIMIRERCPDIIINNTTGGTTGMTMEQRMASLGAYPEMASFDVTNVPVRLNLKARKPPLTGRPKDVTVEYTWAMSYVRWSPKFGQVVKSGFCS